VEGYFLICRRATVVQDWASEVGGVEGGGSGIGRCLAIGERTGGAAEGVGMTV